MKQKVSVMAMAALELGVATIAHSLLPSPRTHLALSLS